MHRPPKILGCDSLPNPTSIRPYAITICDFLAPAIERVPALTSRRVLGGDGVNERRATPTVESLFYKALFRASECHNSPRSITQAGAPRRPSCQWWRQCKQEKTKAISDGQRRGLGYSSRRHAGLNRRVNEDRPTKRRTEKKPTGWDFFDANTLEFAQKSRLPFAFFHDLKAFHDKVESKTEEEKAQDGLHASEVLLKEQMELLGSVRQLEEKLAKAKTSLSDSLCNATASQVQVAERQSTEPTQPKVVLTKDDYKNLVDLYFHTHTSRFDPESPHSSPTPMVLEDYAFKLSEDFAPPKAYAEFYEDEAYESPLKQVERMIRDRQVREVTAFKAFVDLLLDDYSSNLALFRAYKQLPQPGVAFLPKGTVRVFLQRMSTPWQKNEKSMIRYLSLIDDMQKADLPITQAEWASAIYLAGRSFSKVTDTDLNASMRLWKHMEQEAGVTAHNVTFNILFDIAVRANKFPLAQMMLKEMHDRGLQLNRLGRVSIIYYHGLRGDGDAVRKAYRDFVDAGEIVDTLVLNCVMAALYNAQEPTAAEQIYERMKNLHANTRRETRSDGSIAYYRQYPGPGSDVIDRELAANALKRTLLQSRRLKDILPAHHQALQEIMPLRPDHITFRTMISYHANVSGNLNRITVLISEMSKMFGLAMQSIHYQLLFKGFALHGATRSPDATWSLKRLQMVWDSCRQEIKDGFIARKRASMAADVPQLPSVKFINEDGAKEDQGQSNAHKRLSPWDDFVLDLAAFPRERRKHIERIHAELFDEEQEKKEPLIPNLFSRRPAKELPPREQEHYYPLGDIKLDEQEGEYVLPSPIFTIDPSRTEFQDPFFPERADDVHPLAQPEADQMSQSDKSDVDVDPAENETFSTSESKPDSDMKEEQANADTHAPKVEDEPDDAPPVFSNPKYQVEATKSLVCWLLRAYDSSTGSRSQVEEIWNSVRKLWRNQDANDQASVIRVLRRCLRNCDRYGPPM
ncbi:hypothetical protein H2200_004043 [Cladophialophora chaetospira]|uniref:Pentatricopeptide repeat protein n=1 Tax=Cladophialophora chaetospira TaxID=386627 RepID=A0AA38XFK6_9EURO|nr:hypothetical protein H2200_004043 [Cladophialophora chaetospira]